MRRSNRTGMSSSAISAAKLKRPSFTQDYTAYMEHVQISGFLKSSVLVIMMMISSFDIVKRYPEICGFLPVLSNIIGRIFSNGAIYGSKEILDSLAEAFLQGVHIEDNQFILFA